MLDLHYSRANPLPSAMLQAANAYTRSGTVPLPGGVSRRPPLPASHTAEQREAGEREQKAVAAKAAAAAAAVQAQARAQAQVQAQAQAVQAQAANEAAKVKRVAAPQNVAQVQTELERLIALFKAKGGPAAEEDEDDEDDDDEEDDDDSEEEGVVKRPSAALALPKSVPTSGVNTTNATGVPTSLPAALPPPSPSTMSSNTTPGAPTLSAAAIKTSTDAAPSNAIQSELQRLIASLKGKNGNDDDEDESYGEGDDDDENDDDEDEDE